MRFRPCIDIHSGTVKQIVGGSLNDGEPEDLKTNFASTRPSSYYASLYRKDGLRGGHVIKLGPGNDAAAREALAAYPGGLQIGGGLDDRNAGTWLDAGAEKVIVTSFVFRDGRVDETRLAGLVRAVGKGRLVLDLSCRKKEGTYYIVTDRWQKFTDVAVSAETLERLGRSCSEFLVHGVDVEGKCAGIESELVMLLGRHSPRPTTYAGGIASMEDIERIGRLSENRLDFTVGSALDLFGGQGVKYEDMVRLFGEDPP